MKTTTILTALILALAPMAANASCRGGDHAQSISCKAGTTYDVETGACVATTG